MKENMKKIEKLEEKVHLDAFIYNRGVYKKETSTHFRSKDLTQSKTRFLEMKRATRLSHMTVHDTKPAS